MGTDDVVFGNNSLGTISLCAKKLGFFATPSDRPREGARDGGTEDQTRVSGMSSSFGNIYSRIVV